MVPFVVHQPAVLSYVPSNHCFN